MSSSSLLERQKRHHNNIREYSVELGLRTHRPSALTSNFEPLQSAGSLNFTRLRDTDRLSQCSNLPQFDDTGNWWELPNSASVNYEQKTKSVQISYSANEIYGKAKLADFSQDKSRTFTPSRGLGSSSPEKETENGFTGNKGRSLIDDTRPLSESMRTTNVKHSHRNGETTTADTSRSHNLSSTARQRQSEAAKEYLWFTNSDCFHQQYQSGIDRPSNAWTSDDTSQSKHADHSIKFRTFEEAVNVYPSDDSDCSDASYTVDMPATSSVPLIMRNNDSSSVQSSNSLLSSGSPSERNIGSPSVRNSGSPPERVSESMHTEDHQHRSKVSMNASSYKHCQESALNQKGDDQPIPHVPDAWVTREKLEPKETKSFMENSMTLATLSNGKVEHADVEHDGREEVANDKKSPTFPEQNQPSSKGEDLAKSVTKAQKTVSVPDSKLLPLDADRNHTVDTPIAPRSLSPASIVVPPIDLGELSPKKSKVRLRTPSANPANANVVKSTNTRLTRATDGMTKSCGNNFRKSTKVSIRKSTDDNYSSNLSDESTTKSRNNNLSKSANLSRTRNRPATASGSRLTKSTTNGIKPFTGSGSPNSTRNNLKQLDNRLNTASKGIGFHTDSNNSLYSSSLDSPRTKKIAREIRLRVQKNPTEIANEIKRRVQQNGTQISKLSSSTGSSISGYVKLDRHRLASDTHPLINSFRAYDRYIEMSPRIESGEASVWECLPEEIWIIILSFLPIDDLHSFMMTCHDFNRLAHDRSLWYSVIVSKKQVADDEIVKIGHLQPRRLSIIQCTGIKLNGDQVSNKGLREMFTSLGHHLTYLSTAHCISPPLSGEAMLHHAIVHCPNVTSLNLSWCNLTDRDVELVAENFSNLKSFSLNGNQTVTDSGFLKVTACLSNQLERLELQGCFKLSNRILPEIGQCINLRNLNIGQCHKFSSSRIQSEVSRLSSLEVVNFKGLKQIKDCCIAQIVKFCPNIHHLIISQCTSLTSKSLTEISCALSSLTSLEVSSCKECVNDASVYVLLANCKNLVSLDLSSTNVGNSSVEVLAHSCPRLSKLKLNFCSVTESGIKELLVTSKSLCKVQLYGVKGLQMQELSELNSAVTIEN